MFNNFCLKLSNEAWNLEIRNDEEDDSIITVAATEVGKYAVNDMLLTSKDILESLLLIYFGFDDDTVKKVLDEIKEIPNKAIYKL